jgi:hypothetical protein
MKSGIRYPASPDIRYPAFGFHEIRQAGYPAKSVSDASLIFTTDKTVSYRYRYKYSISYTGPVPVPSRPKFFYFLFIVYR